MKAIAIAAAMAAATPAAAAEYAPYSPHRVDGMIEELQARGFDAEATAASASAMNAALAALMNKDGGVAGVCPEEGSLAYSVRWKTRDLRSGTATVCDVGFYGRVEIRNVVDGGERVALEAVKVEQWNSPYGSLWAVEGPLEEGY